MTAKQVFQLFIVILICFGIGLSEFVVIGIEPELAAGYGITLEQAGLTISVFAASYAICTPVLAFVTGRFRRYTLLVVYGAIMTAGAFASVMANSFAMLLVARMAIGAVAGATLALCVTFVPELMPVRLQPIGISFVYSAYSVAMVIITSIGRIAAVSIGWHVMMTVAFAGMLISSALAAAFLPRSGSTDEPATAREQLVLVQQPRVIVGMITFIFGVAAIYTFYSYITPYMEKVLGLQPTQTATALFVFGIFGLISNVMQGLMELRWGYRSLIGNFFFLALGLAGVWACGSYTPGALAFMMLAGLFMYSLATPIVSMFMQQARLHCPKGITLAASLDPMTFNLGIVAGTAVGGYLVVGPGIQFLGAAGALLALGALALVFLNLRIAK